MNASSHADLEGVALALFGAPPAARRPHQTHPDDLVVLRRRGRPRMLVPATGRRAGAGIVVGRPGLTRPREARLRTALGTAMLTGVPQSAAFRRGPVILGGSAGGPTELVAVLRTWEPRVRSVGFSVRPLTANHKPTFVAVDRSGRVLGFGKIAADDGATVRVRAEAAALADLAAHPVAGLRVPPVLAELTWRGRPVLVLGPLPWSARRRPNDSAAPQLLVAAARARGAGLDVVGRAEELADEIGRSEDAELAEAAADVVARLRADLSGVWSAAGRSHGDLVPWNVASAGPGELCAWDWEHSRPADLVGLDVLHWYVQVARHVHNQPLLPAHDDAESVARMVLAGTGHGPEEITALRRVARLLVVARWVTLGRASAAAGRPDPEGGLRSEMLALLRQHPLSRR